MNEPWSDHAFEEYFTAERKAVWDRLCKHDRICNCSIWERTMRDLETFSEGKLQIVHFGNKLNLGGCNVCSAIDGRAHCFNKVTANIGGDDNIVVSCDCQFRLGQPKGCTCPVDGYAIWDDEDE